MDLVHIRFSVCGTHLWNIAVPRQEIVLHLRKDSGETWSFPIRDPALCRDDPALRTEIEDELKLHMYPVLGYFELWIEDRNGNTIEHKSDEMPGSFQYVTTQVRHRSALGNEVIWMGERCTVTHRITLNPDFPHSFEILASQWPPALFYQGNNRLIGNAFFALDEQSIKLFTQKIKAGAKALGSHLVWFITNANKPLETGF